MLYFLIPIFFVLTMGSVHVFRNILPLFLLRPGNRVGTETPADYGLAYEHFRLPVTSDITLDSFFIPATTTPKANLIILHGVGSCKETYLFLTERLCAMGFNLFLPDQRVHGKSDGKYLTYGFNEKKDVAKMVDWLVDRTASLPTGIYGNSMGAAVALQSLDYDHRLAFGLTESTFTDLPTVTRAYARRMGFRGTPDAVIDFLLRRAGVLAGFDPWQIRPLDVVTRLHQPILFIHGDADVRINVSNGRQLYAACGSADKTLYIVPGGDHADLWEIGDKNYPEVWFGFLQRMANASVTQ